MIRKASTNDVGRIVQMLQTLRLESPAYAYVDNDPEYVKDNLVPLFDSGTMFGVIDVYKGFMIGLVSAQWYSRRVNAYEQLLYVAPEYRGGSVALRLVRSFETMCKELGCYSLRVGASTGMQDDRTRAMYERMGYTYSGYSLSKEL